MMRFVWSSATVFALTLSLLSGNANAQDKKKDDKKVDKVAAALPDKAPAQPKQPRKLLIFSRTAGYPHGSIPTGIRAITKMGEKTGAYTALQTTDESIFEPEKLKDFDAVFMLNTTGDCLLPKAGKDGKSAKELEEVYKKSLHDFVAGGKGLIGVHSATDTYQKNNGTSTWKDYTMMMGGAFAGHPWHTKVPIKNLEPKNPVNAAFDGGDFEIVDEIYQFANDTALAKDRRILLSLDTKKMDVSKGSRKDGSYPVSWIATYGKGRTFYCSLGHNDHIFWNPMILKHYLSGIQYALGDLEADATPTAKQ